MLILRPFKGVYYVMDTRYPDGHIAAYRDEDNARAFVQWIHDMKLDIAGLLGRLYFDRLTDADRVLICRINRASRHTSRVWSTLEPVEHKLARLRAKASPEVN